MVRTESESRVKTRACVDERHCRYEIRTCVTTRKAHRGCADRRGRRWRSDGVRCDISRTGPGPRHRWAGAGYCHTARGEPRENAAGEHHAPGGYEHEEHL